MTDAQIQAQSNSFFYNKTYILIVVVIFLLISLIMLMILLLLLRDACCINELKKWIIFDFDREKYRRSQNVKKNIIYFRNQPIQVLSHSASQMDINRRRQNNLHRKGMFAQTISQPNSPNLNPVDLFLFQQKLRALQQGIHSDHQDGEAFDARRMSAPFPETNHKKNSSYKNKNLQVLQSSQYQSARLQPAFPLQQIPREFQYNPYDTISQHSNNNQATPQLQQNLRIQVFINQAENRRN